MCGQLRCEVCGRRIFGKPFRVVIEGAKLTVCTDCSKHGKIVWEEEPKPKPAIQKSRILLPSLQVQTKKLAETPTATTMELVEDFHVKIRQAREKLGLSHEDLGKRLNEKVSLLRKIETGKMTPNNSLATRLEHALKIKLIVPASDEKLKIPPAKMVKAAKGEVTLGDLIQFDSKDSKEKEEPTKRKQS